MNFIFYSSDEDTSSFSSRNSNGKSKVKEKKKKKKKKKGKSTTMSEDSQSDSIQMKEEKGDERWRKRLVYQDDRRAKFAAKANLVKKLDAKKNRGKIKKRIAKDLTMIMRKIGILLLQKKCFRTV